MIHLAHVAGPAVIHQDLHGGRIDPGQGLSIALCVLAEEMFREQRNILAPIAQRRQVNLDRVQPEVEVLAESARLDS